MLPVSTKKPVAFTPASYEGAEGAPVYLIEVPTVLRRAELARDIAATGAKNHSDAALLEMLREAVEAYVEQSQRGELMDLIDQCEAAGLTLLDKELSAKLTDLQEQIAEYDDCFRNALADRAYWYRVAPIVAAQMFLVGIEGQKPLPRRHGKLVDGVLEDLPMDDVDAIGWKAFVLMSVSKEQEKNCDSPSTLPQGQETLPTA